ncbi:GM20701 [Drosophila sechellia]|uniref:GM20701 n=1 Tax=Drosophila sechellia TaxID=7238 RepID=B4HRV1_DROSE|nr:GM20701 [Drosophila sechellia]
MAEKPNLAQTGGATGGSCDNRKHGQTAKATQSAGASTLAKSSRRSALGKHRRMANGERARRKKLAGKSPPENARPLEVVLMLALVLLFSAVVVELEVVAAAEAEVGENRADEVKQI